MCAREKGREGGREAERERERGVSELCRAHNTPTAPPPRQTLVSGFSLRQVSWSAGSVRRLGTPATDHSGGRWVAVYAAAAARRARLLLSAAPRLLERLEVGRRELEQPLVHLLQRPLRAGPRRPAFGAGLVGGGGRGLRQSSRKHRGAAGCESFETTRTAELRARELRHSLEARGSSDGPDRLGRWRCRTRP